MNGDQQLTPSSRAINKSVAEQKRIPIFDLWERRQGDFSSRWPGKWPLVRNRIFISLSFRWLEKRFVNEILDRGRRVLFFLRTCAIPLIYWTRNVPDGPYCRRCGRIIKESLNFNFNWTKMGQFRPQRHLSSWPTPRLSDCFKLKIEQNLVFCIDTDMSLTDWLIFDGLGVLTWLINTELFNSWQIYSVNRWPI
jgi:hypothetical protein